MNAQPSASLRALGVQAALTVLVLAAHLAIIGSWRGPVWAPSNIAAQSPIALSLSLVSQAPPVRQANSALAQQALSKARPQPLPSNEASAQANTDTNSGATPETPSETNPGTSTSAITPITPDTTTDAKPNITPDAAKDTDQDIAQAAADTPERQPLITQAGTAPMRLPEALKLRYKLQGQAKGFAYSARGEMGWLPQGNRYEARLEISAFLLGSRVQTSRGDITEQGLRPKRFSDKVRSEVAAHFEWDEGRVIFSANSPQAVL